MSTTSEKDWGAEDWRQPTIQPGDKVLFSECGRILRGLGPRAAVDCRSHSFRLVQPEFEPITLCVKHGGGEERHAIDHSSRIVAVVAALDSDARYWLFHTLLRAVHDAATAARDRTASEYRKAFVGGRLKKRKQPSRGTYRVWIEPAATQTAARESALIPPSARNL